MNRTWLWLILVVAGAAYGFQHRQIAQTSADFVALAPPRPLPPLLVDDGPSRNVLDDQHGKFVLLNIWATWCAPCRKEMPGLDRLQQRLGGRDFEVVALSIDKGGRADVEKFYRALGIAHLAIRLAANSDDVKSLSGVYGVPTTFLLDRQGDAIGRLVGAATWDSDEMLQFLKKQMER